MCPKHPRFPREATVALLGASEALLPGPHSAAGTPSGCLPLCPALASELQGSVDQTPRPSPWGRPHSQARLRAALWQMALVRVGPSAGLLTDEQRTDILNLATQTSTPEKYLSTANPAAFLQTAREEICQYRCLES